VRSAEVFKCPSDPFAETLLLSYQMSGPLARVSEGQIDAPAETVLLIDSNDPEADCCRKQDGQFLVSASCPGSTVVQPVTELTPGTLIDGFNPVHQKGANAAFVDGHVARVKPGQLTADNFRPFSFD